MRNDKERGSVSLVCKETESDRNEGAGFDSEVEGSVRAIETDSASSCSGRVNGKAFFFEGSVLAIVCRSSDPGTLKVSVDHEGNDPAT